MVDAQEIAFLIDGLVVGGLGLVLILIGYAIGWFGGWGVFFTQYANPVRKRHRGILWAIAGGCLFFAVPFFLMTNNTALFARSDGKVTEFGGWAGRIALGAFITWALAESVFMHLENTLVLLAFVVGSYTFGLITNFVVGNSNFAVTLVATYFFWLLALIASIQWSNLSKTRWLMSYIAIGWIYAFMAIQILWLILGPTVANVTNFNYTVEAWVLMGTDIAYAVGAAVLIGFSYFGNIPGIDSPIYYEYLPKDEQQRLLMEEQPVLSHQPQQIYYNQGLTINKMQ